MPNELPLDLRLIEGSPRVGMSMWVRTGLRPPAFLVASRSRDCDSAHHDNGESPPAALLEQDGWLAPLEALAKDAPLERVCLPVQIERAFSPKGWIAANMERMLSSGRAAAEVVLRLKGDRLNEAWFSKARATLDGVRRVFEQSPPVSTRLAVVVQGRLAPQDVGDLIHFIDTEGASPVITIPAHETGMALPEGSAADALAALSTAGVLPVARMTLDDAIPESEILSRFRVWAALCRGGGFLLTPRMQHGRPAISGERFAKTVLAIYEAQAVPSERLYPMNLFLSALLGWFPGFCYACSPFGKGAGQVGDLVRVPVVGGVSGWESRRRLCSRVCSGLDPIAHEQWAFILLNLLRVGCFDGGLTRTDWTWLSRFADVCLPVLLSHIGEELETNAANGLSLQGGPETRRRAILDDGTLQIVRRNDDRDAGKAMHNGIGGV